MKSDSEAGKPVIPFIAGKFRPPMHLLRAGHGAVIAGNDTVSISMWRGAAIAVPTAV